MKSSNKVFVYLFFSDPDFVGFVTVACENRCKMHYHNVCWKDYKESLSDAVKLQDKVKRN